MDNELNNSKLKEFMPSFKNFFKDKKRRYIFFALAIIIFIIIRNMGFIPIYEKDKSIARIVNIKQKENNHTKNQEIIGVIENGPHKGEKVCLTNYASSLFVFGTNLEVKDEVIIEYKEDGNHKILTASIIDFKRDTYIFLTAFIFAILITLIGGYKGFQSLISLIINTIVFIVSLKFLLSGYNPFLITIIASIIYIINSIAIVNGINKKTSSAIIGTMLGTFLSILITIAVLHFTKTQGIGYQEAEFLAHLPEKANITFEEVFLIEILIGSLGAIMDIAISISSSINEICDKNPSIKKKELINSGFEIGKDIMGTMANTLVFAYISGSIPVILIMLSNGIAFIDVISNNISLEIIRAISGSIGIVLSIPITIYASIFLLKNQKIGEA